MALFNPVVTSPYQQPLANYPAYPQLQAPQMQQVQQPQQQNNQTHNSIIWVQGNAAAKSYPVAPGTTVMMLDSEEPVFYIKTVDASGMPAPLRVFDFAERVETAPHHIDTDEFITREEFERRIAELGKEKLNETKKRQSIKGNDISTAD